MYITEGERVRCNARLYLLRRYGSVVTGKIWYQVEEDAFIILINLSKKELELQENTWTEVFTTPDTKMLRKGFNPKLNTK